MSATTLFRIYYLGTPLFMLADYLLGFPMRVSGIEEPGYRLLYYLFCLGCAAALYLWPTRTTLLALAESSLNIFLLIHSVMGPVMSLGSLVTSGEPLPKIMTPEQLLNFLLAGSILIYGFHATTAALHESG
jgi:hypothetical protein